MDRRLVLADKNLFYDFLDFCHIDKEFIDTAGFIDVYSYIKVNGEDDIVATNISFRELQEYYFNKYTTETIYFYNKNCEWKNVPMYLIDSIEVDDKEYKKVSDFYYSYLYVLELYENFKIQERVPEISDDVVKELVESIYVLKPETVRYCRNIIDVFFEDEINMYGCIEIRD